MKFKTLEQIQETFRSESGGSVLLPRHRSVRYEDIEKNTALVEELLNSEYNTVSGITFSQVMEAISEAQTHNPTSYLIDCKTMKSDPISESFFGTTQAQAPFPLPSKGITLYQYSRSVIPYYAHIFDLKGNQGLAYYMKLTSKNTIGDVTEGDLLASPIRQSKQSNNFIGTRMINKEVALTVAGEVTIENVIPNAPIQPQTLVLSIEGLGGSFQDLSTVTTSGVVVLTSVDGNLGTCQVDLNTGEFTMVLKSAPVASGSKVLANYNRDVQTIDGGKTNQAVVTPTVEAIHLKAKDYSIRVDTNLHQERLAQAIFGLNWNAEVDEMLGAIYNKEIANSILTDIKGKIPGASKSTHDISKNTGGNNDYFNTMFTAFVIPKLRTSIAKASGLAGARPTALAINTELLPVFEGLPKFNSVEIGEDFMGGQALVGTYDGTPVVMAYDPILTDGQMVGLYKSKQKEFLTPAVFGTFILPVMREVYDQDNLSVNRKQLISSAASQTVAENLAAQITINNIGSVI